jgi:acyl-CoA synthetase (AMP-forming)/AMP-acid ligase II
VPTSVAPLTPLMFLERSSRVFPDKTAIVHGDRRIAYRDFADETTRLAHGLRASGIAPGDRVAYLGEQELIDHCRARIARYKAPKAIEFIDELPKTSTGKVQKFELREREWAGQEARIRG